MLCDGLDMAVSEQRDELEDNGSLRQSEPTKLPPAVGIIVSHGEATDSAEGIAIAFTITPLQKY